MGKNFLLCNKFIDIFFKVYLCHDHDTGSELAVKQVEVGFLNTATQKVRQHLNLFFLLGYVLVQNLASVVILNNTIYRGLCNVAPSFKNTVHRQRVVPRFLQLYQSEQITRAHVKTANREEGDTRRKDESHVSRGWPFSRALPRFACCSIPEKNRSFL